MFTTTKRGASLLLLAPFLWVAQAAMADITNGLVAYYNFEGLIGIPGEVVVDQSGNGHNGVCRQDQYTIKTPTLVPGPTGLGNALNFDGNFYVQIPNAPDFNVTSNLTVAAWVSVDVFNTEWQMVFCRGDWSWRLQRWGNTDFVTFDMNGLANGYGASGQTTDVRVPKRWLHLVGTYQNGVGACLYVNGMLEATNYALSGFINTNGSDPVTIGAQIDYGTLRRQWLGQIDEVRLYNRALSSDEVAELEGFTLAGFNNGPNANIPASFSLDAPTNVQLQAIINDDGYPLPANPLKPAINDPNQLRWGWSARSWPVGSTGPVWIGNPTTGQAFTYSGSAHAPWTPFTNSPTVVFDVPGLYVLNFSVSDGEKTNSQDLTVQIRSRNDYRALGYSYLSPLPGTEYVSSQTSLILLRFASVSPFALTNLAKFISVTGAESGVHPGLAKIAADGHTVMFQMDSAFTEDEIVTVSLAPGVPAAAGGPVPPYTYQFVVSGHWPDSAPQFAQAAAAAIPRPAAATVTTTVSPKLQAIAPAKGVAGVLPNGISVPSDFPWITITVNTNPDPDPIFIDNRAGGGDPFNVIFDNHGWPLWYSRYPDERRDMTVQHNGRLSMLSYADGTHFNSLDNHYQLVTNYWAANGFSVDDHELQIMPDGTVWLIALQNLTVDMSRCVAGGDPAALLTEDAIQEFSPAGELIFQWRAWEHLDILDEQQFIDLLANSMDFPHMNAIDIDTDGNILLSARSTSEVTKINRETGDIIWRLGGVHNQFTFVNDPLNGPRNQHAVRMVTTNDYTMFDNGNLHNPPASRGVEYRLDTNAMTATLVWQYPDPPSSNIFSFYMGDVQRLTNGNTLINWAVGNLPKLTEVRSDGTKAFEMNWADGWESYRVWRCPWQGVALQPYLIVEPYPDNITLIFNQFGDTNVAFYKLYGGPVSQSTNLLATSGATFKQLTDLPNGVTNYFRVTAVNQQGVEGPASNEESTYVNIIQPGQAMISNGDFSQGMASWIWTLTNGATAAWAVESGVSHFYITNATSALANIQLKQTGQPLILGKTYVFEFDAWSALPRYIQAEVAQDAAPNLFYGGAVSTFLTPIHNHYRYVFTMTATSDFNASVLFNFGGSAAGVFLDHVSLYYCPEGDLNADGAVNLLDLQVFAQNWLNQQNGLGSDLDGSGTVDFKDFGILGENW